MFLRTHKKVPLQREQLVVLVEKSPLHLQVMRNKFLWVPFLNDTKDDAVRFALITISAYKKLRLRWKQGIPFNQKEAYNEDIKAIAEECHTLVLVSEHDHKNGVVIQLSLQPERDFTDQSKIKKSSSGL